MREDDEEEEKDEAVGRLDVPPVVVVLPLVGAVDGILVLEVCIGAEVGIGVPVVPVGLVAAVDRLCDEVRAAVPVCAVEGRAVV